MEDFIKELLRHISDNSYKIEFNKNMLDITEGDLVGHIRMTLSKQLSSAKNVDAAMQRCAPINVWSKIVKKLSKLYATPPKRLTTNTTDQDLVEHYEKQGINKVMADTNFNYNNYKWTSIELYEDAKEEKLKFRSVSSNLFLPYSDDKIDPMRVTGIIKFMGMQKCDDGNHRSKFWYYSKDTFIAFTDNGQLYKPDMELNEGENPFGVIPFEYLSMSRNFLIPNPDKDTYQMTVNIPVLITDQNFASLYLSIPIIYTTNIDADELPQSPNAFWNLKALDPDSPTSVGVIKPEPDLANQMNNVRQQLSMWLESRDIKPGTVGSLTPSTFPNGISQIIAEMDTIGNMNEQKECFKPFEIQFWKKLATMHNYLVDTGRLRKIGKFSNPDELIVVVDFQESAVIESKVEKITRLKAEMDAQLKSKKSAIKELNPDMTDGQIDILILEIENDNTTLVERYDDVSSKENTIGSGQNESNNGTAIMVKGNVE